MGRTGGSSSSSILVDVGRARRKSRTAGETPLATAVVTTRLKGFGSCPRFPPAPGCAGTDVRIFVVLDPGFAACVTLITKTALATTASDTITSSVRGFLVILCTNARLAFFIRVISFRTRPRFLIVIVVVCRTFVEKD